MPPFTHIYIKKERRTSSAVPKTIYMNPCGLIVGFAAKPHVLINKKCAAKES